MFETITVDTLAEMAQDLLRSYGFRCDNMIVELELGRGLSDAKGTGLVKVTWNEEMAQGQAAFSQFKVRPQAKFVVEALKGAESGDEIGHKLGHEELDITLVYVAVHYTHHNGGSNGIERHFVVDRFRGRLIERN